MTDNIKLILVTGWQEKGALEKGHSRLWADTGMLHCVFKVQDRPFTSVSSLFRFRLTSVRYSEHFRAVEIKT